MASKPSSKSLAWPLFDAIVGRSEFAAVNPWRADGSFAPDYTTLRKLLAVPLLLGAESRSGVPALALDVWVAYELRRAGLDPDAVWPRAEPPRVVDRDVLAFVKSIPKAAGRDDLLARLRNGSTAGVGAASANIAGKNYFKQVDVIMSSWQTGPELLISTKRMDSSFGKNAANRVEESYGDAKNLALRHPLAALGFVYCLRSTAYTEERRQFDWIADLLVKLGREADAYDACALVVPEWEGDTPPEVVPLEPEDAILDLFDVDVEDVDKEATVDIESQLAALPEVTLRTDLVPDELSPARFFAMMLTIVLDNSNITQHEEARLRRSRAVG